MKVKLEISNRSVLIKHSKKIVSRKLTTRPIVIVKAKTSHD